MQASRFLPCARWLGLLGITALLGGIAGASQAATFVPESSALNLRAAFLPEHAVPALPGTEGLVSLIDDGLGGHRITLDSSVWSASGFHGSSLYTGVPNISDVWLSARNRQAVFESGYSHTNFVGGQSVVGPYLGGVSPLDGAMVIWVLGQPAFQILDLNLVGGPPGGQETFTMGGIPFAITGGPWLSGPVVITGVTTNMISWNGVKGAVITVRPPPGADYWPCLSEDCCTYLCWQFCSLNTDPEHTCVPLEVHTVTLSGSNQLLSAASGGAVTLVAPVRIDTSAFILGRVPGAAEMRLTFVPEPGTLLLLMGGALGLLALGRRQMRR